MRAKKLHVKCGDQWKPVFCHSGGEVATCENAPRKALPGNAIWADDDLKWFSEKFADREFKLITINC